MFQQPNGPIIQLSDIPLIRQSNVLTIQRVVLCSGEVFCSGIVVCSESSGVERGQYCVVGVVMYGRGSGV